MIKTINPATLENLQEYPLLTSKQLDTCIDNSHKVFLSWRKSTFSERAELMQNIATILTQKKGELATLIAKEMGKPIKEGIGEIEKTSWLCEYFANNAEKYLTPREIKTDFEKTIVYYEPLGIVFGIMPWNYPFWQVFRYAVPTIMAGNSVLLKHASAVTGCALKINELFIQAGFPTDLFQTLVIDSQSAHTVIANPQVKAVTLTGSNKAGSKVAACAGKYLKKVVLELGGNDPYVVLADADLKLAAKAIISSRMKNAGQVCIAAKRAIVVREVLDELNEYILDEAKKIKSGDPLDKDTDIGPLAREDLKNTLNEQVSSSIKLGAQIKYESMLSLDTGFYYPITILTNVKPGMPAFDEELFGPVLAIVPVENEEQAIKLANKSIYGLGGAVFSKNIKRAAEIAQKEIETGSCFVNSTVSSDPRVPFGGINQSGFGRELSQEGILEFINIKTVSINT